MSSNHSSRGFAYLWMLFLVAFMGLGLAVAAESWSIATRRDKERELLFVGGEFRAALKSYFLSQMRAGQREYPISLDALLRDDRFPGVKRHLRRIYMDPITGTAEWGLVMRGGRIVGVHSLSEKVPLKQANFDLDDVALAGAGSYTDWVFTYSAFGPEGADGAMPELPPPALVMPGADDDNENDTGNGNGQTP